MSKGRPTGRYGPRDLRIGWFNQCTFIPGTRVILDPTLVRSKKTGEVSQYAHYVRFFKYDGRVYVTNWVVQYIIENGMPKPHDGLHVRTSVDDLESLGLMAWNDMLVYAALHPRGLDALKQLMDGIKQSDVDAVREAIEGSPRAVDKPKTNGLDAFGRPS